MSNSFKMDLNRLLMPKGYLLFAVGVAVVYPIVLTVVLKLVGMAMGESFACTLQSFTVYSLSAALYLAIIITEFLHMEVNEGILRNKIISGKNRAEILGSYCLVMAIFAVVLQILSAVSVMVSMWVCRAEFEIPSRTDVVSMTALYAVAGACVSVFYCALYCIFCTTKAAMILPALVAVCTKLGMMYVQYKLYPETGVCTLTGMKLSVFTFLDRYMPFSYFLMVPHWDIASYVIGCGGMAVISLIVGLIVFERTDLK